MDKGRMHACMSPHPLQSGCRQRGSCPKADTLKAGSDKLVLKRCQGAASVFTEKGAGTQRSPPPAARRALSPCSRPGLAPRDPLAPPLQPGRGGEHDPWPPAAGIHAGSGKRGPWVASH